MNTKAGVEDFLKQKRIALVGLSRKTSHFSNTVYKELKKKGYEMIPVNPAAETISGEQCYPDLASLSGKVDAALVMTPSSQTASVVKSAADAGIKHVWVQQGAETDEAEKAGEEKDLNLISGECVMMFAEPTAFLHKFHRWIWGRLGKLPA